MMPFLSRMSSSGSDLYYAPGFMNEIEVHLSYLRTSSETRTAVVPLEKAIIYSGDFYGYCREAKIESQYHWTIMRVSFMRSPADFGVKTKEIMVPSVREINRILTNYRTSLSNRI
jgi:hypothetical protein